MDQWTDKDEYWWRLRLERPPVDLEQEGMMRQVGSPKFRCFSFCTSNGKDGLSKHLTRKYNSASAFSVSSYFLKSPTRCYLQIHKKSKMSSWQLSMSLNLSSHGFESRLAAFCDPLKLCRALIAILQGKQCLTMDLSLFHYTVKISLCTCTYLRFYKFITLRETYWLADELLC